MNLFNKTILITGGSEGLGLELAKILLAERAEVIICGRSKEKLDNASQILASSKLRTFKCDVSDYNQVELLVKNIAKLDVLINNAGLYLDGAIEATDPSDISNILDVNIKGLIYTTKVSLKLLKKAREAFIVNILSTKAIEPASNLSVYTASKYGARGFSESLKIELKSTNVRILDFCPASMNTDFHYKAGSIKDKSKWMNPEDVAKVILFALKGDSPLTFETLVVRNR